ncbi:unnamed protein product [Ceutorhynchus assimilis]|uniref:Uncharacterized protein n=1 Tax=Ceutorhynchus assimilis TaxID=467358 RepID=A0A9N9QNM4_9CUCU|nr:unnamed protein product [Ceutorhynchus assimilis]
MIECDVNNQMACLSCKQLNASCIHFERDMTLSLTRDKSVVTLKANRDAAKGYCIKSTRKRKCNPLTGNWVLFETDPETETMGWICKCTYPNLVTQINLASDCDVEVGCGKYGKFARSDIDPMSLNCLCDDPYISAFDNIRGPHCRLPKIFEIKTDVSYLPDQATIPVSSTDPEFRHKFAHPNLRHVPDPCRFIFEGNEPAAGCHTNGETLGVHIWPSYLPVADDFGECNFAMKRTESIIEGYLFYSHPKYYDKIIPIYMTDLEGLRRFSWATNERLRSMWQFQIKVGTPPASIKDFNANKHIYVMSAYIEPDVHIPSSVIDYHYEESRWFSTTPNRQYNCGFYNRFGAGYLDSPYPIKPCMGQWLDGPSYPLLSPCRLTNIGDYEANRCSQSACYWHNFIWPSNERKYTENHWGYPSLMFRVAQSSLHHGLWKAKLFPPVYTDQSDFKRVFYHDGRRIIFNPKDVTEANAIVGPNFQRRIARDTEATDKDDGVSYFVHPSGTRPAYKFQSTSLKYHLDSYNTDFIRK